MPSSALACGGFFCNNSAPVDQSAERIVFAVDEGEGTVDTHVQIFYQGDAQDFAWIVPTPNLPELFLSTDELFTQLDWQTRPYFNLMWEEWGDCYQGGGILTGNTQDDTAEFDSADEDGGDPGVTIIEQAQVGPYDTVILQADTSAELITWLQDNNYDLPDTLDTVLNPYVAGEQYFVALKLQKDKEVGDIAPIGFTYAGTQPAVPIQLTSVAATPDMRLEVYVFSEERAVPENYYHVQINEAAVDWLSGGSNYNSVITLAADEAGGHAFATDFSGSTTPFAGSLHWAGRYDTAAIASATSPEQAMDAIMGQFAASGTLMNLLLSYMPPPEGVDAQSFYNCVGCYETGGMTVDYEGFAAALDEFLVQPAINAEKLFTEHSTVSRMTSSLSPLEMTIDPMFVQNSTMADVSNVHEATLIMDCRGNRSWYDARRRVVLEDGRVILLPSQEYFDGAGESSADFLAESTDVNALVIEQTSADGEPVLLTDNREAADANLDDHNDRVDEIEGAVGCGCSASGGAGSLLFALPLLALIRRRQA